MCDDLKPRPYVLLTLSLTTKLCAICVKKEGGQINILNFPTKKLIYIKEIFKLRWGRAPPTPSLAPPLYTGHAAKVLAIPV